MTVLHFDDILQFHWSSHTPDEKGVSEKKLKFPLEDVHWQGAWTAVHETSYTQEACHQFATKPCTTDLAL